MATPQSIDYPIQELTHQAETDRIEYTDSGILFYKVGLPFPFFISVLEKKVLESPILATDEKYTQAYDDLNVTIFILCKEFSPELIESITPNLARIPSQLFKDERRDYLSRVQEVMLIRNIRYSSNQGLITDSYNQLLESERDLVKRVTAPFIRKGNQHGIARSEFINEARFHIYDIVANHYKISEGNRLNTFLYVTLHRHLVKYLAEFIAPASIKPYSLNRYNRKLLKYGYLYSVIDGLLYPMDSEYTQISDGRDLELEIIGQELFELCVSIIEERANRKWHQKKFRTIAQDLVLENRYLVELGQVLADQFGVTRADISYNKVEILALLRKAITERSVEGRRFPDNNQVEYAY